MADLASKAEGYLQKNIIRFTIDFTAQQPVAISSIANSLRYSDSTGSLSDIPNNHKTLRTLLLSTATESSDFSAILFGNTLGGAITVRNTSGYYSVGTSNRTTRDYIFYSVDTFTGDLISYDAGLSSKNYDPRSRPWYIPSVGKNNPVWAPIYINLNNPPSLVLSISYPFYNRTNSTQQLGVIAAQVTLDKISQYINQQEAGADIFIMERNTNLVALSVGSVLSSVNSTITRISATKHPNTVVADTSQYIVNQYGPNMTSLKKTSFSFTDSKGYDRIVLIQSYQDGYGLDWIVVSVVSVADIMGSVITGTIIAGVISGIAVLFSVAIAILFGCFISVPLKQISNEMKYVANMELGKRIPSITLRLNEFNEMNDSMTQMKQGLSNFQKFVPAEVVRSLLRSGTGVRLGVKHRSLTLLFMDIKDFTTITETIEPNVLIGLMSKFFKQMGEAIMQNGGTIDKFIGDCIMAFWNAPELVERHEMKALDASFEMRKRLEFLNQKWSRLNYPHVSVRIGINTAYSLVGNVGAPERINYTALGDGVNVAARLEGMF
jgi:adenylate cyclase